MDIASTEKASVSSAQHTVIVLLKDTNSLAEDFYRSSIRYTSDRNKDKVAVHSDTVNDSCLFLEGNNCAS